MEPLATPAELTTYLQGPTIADGLATLALAGASGMVRDYCGWHIAPVVEETFVVDGTGGDVLTLPTLRLVSVAEIRIDDVPYHDFVAFPRGQIYRCGAWPRRVGVVAADVTHGLDETPDSVRAVVLALAGRIISNPSGGSIRTLTVGGVSQTFEAVRDDMTELQAAQLAQVRLS